MFSLKITDKRVTQALMPHLDDDIAAVASDEASAAEVAEIDTLIEEAEREWAAAEQREAARVSQVFTDQTRARRARRREDRTVLRVLPARLSVSDVVDEVA
ncbi:hypothetical protein [Actinophytocola oryzae]|uniref:Uncharacterized protein n=1 Tax=Actinophytocola oryzae TaxID=502181 RepID=A0A4R7V9C9_9PSEU|nr:hypothetical protein [Actinophytocola oryzae]TDV45528.1 hypothetical protein CLV71_112197 [Actinophytocola oryzae]